MIRAHQRLEVWQDAMTLVEQVYRYSAHFPADERFGLTSQLRRAAVSVPANVAEGAARTSRLDYFRFLSMARGSLSEVDTHLLLATRLQFAAEDAELLALVNRVAAKLNALMKSLQAKND